ncbi:hypothetical protein PFLmoz3_05000 [Pseudomonas fluorescens]|uniref:Uncharacterized protein n=1 Tax=Pseudomonas fluorescens TaxID=294 RepID=A0A109LDB2_PSEFL|nr:hypothetical protein PFLmoz3_05000 [Pseudomonas fluorescens]
MLRITSSTEPICSLLTARASTSPTALLTSSARVVISRVLCSMIDMPSRADWSAPRAALAALEALLATSWAVALISFDAVATWSISRNCTCMPSLVWRAMADD